MPYSKDNKEYKVSNVKYLNKDFASLKSALVNYAKTYFPNTYKDFNESSPGMMMMEMSAYVGDVLSFYIDQQYREMLLPLAEERKNVINIAKSLGYRVKPIAPAFVDLEFTQTVTADVSDIDNIVPNWTETFTINTGQQVKAGSDASVVFETLDAIDFRSSGSYKGDSTEITNTDTNTGLVNEYTLKRTIRAISGETKTKTFSVGAPEKFFKLTLPEDNVIEVLEVVDSNRNKWYEVDFLAQDKVPISTHYLDNPNRPTAYSNLGTGDRVAPIPVPYTLEYIRTSKRFTLEIDESKTSIVFGNGILRNNQVLGTDFFESEQIGLTIPGSQENLLAAVDPLIGDESSTLGETPAHTTLTVKYRVGGGISANVPAGDLVKLGTVTTSAGTDNGSLSVTNVIPAAGGSGPESIDEIKSRANAYFAAQSRCVTRDDYKARILNIPAKYGNVAKVYVDKVTSIQEGANSQIFDFSQIANQLTNEINLADINQDGQVDVQDVILLLDNVLGQTDNYSTVPQYVLDNLRTGVSVYLLSYSNNKELVETPMIIQSNLSSYLEEFRILTDEVIMLKGKIINFGVLFDVVANRGANKQEVKLKCIQTIIDYFSIDKMQFRQPINTNDLIYELMGVDGVRSVNHITLTQDYDWGSPVLSSDSSFSNAPEFTPGLWTNVYDTNTGEFSDNISVNGGQSGYGFHYDFSQFYQNPTLEKGFILPSVEPAVFELKNPNENVKGVVR